MDIEKRLINIPAKEFFRNIIPAIIKDVDICLTLDQELKKSQRL